MKLLTIIIPTYNMEKYLHKCLDSLLIKDNQERLEILVINDGSKDNSSKIAHEYEMNYPHMFRVIDKENGNYGSCINRGLKEATGKYIKVLDADDSFNTESLKQFIDILQNIDVDLVLTDYVRVNEEDKELCHNRHTITLNTVLPFENFCNMPAFMKGIEMHAVTYKRQNILDINYRQTEGISYTDQEWIFSPMSTVRTAYYANIVLYRYLIGREGQTMDSKIMLKCISHTEQGIISMLKARQSILPAKQYIDKYLKYRILSRLSYIYRKYLLESNDLQLNNLKSFDSEFKNIDKNIYSLSNNITIHKFFPFKYVQNWRKKQLEHKYWFSSLYSIITK